MIDIKANEKLSILNHSGAHLLAQALKNLYPHALFWVGPVVREGFYYDVDLGEITLTEADLPLIEAEMEKIVIEALPILKKEITKTEALELFKNNPYKRDLINDINTETVTIYKQGAFIDLCRGPHVESTKELKYFKLLKVAGAYYQGDVKQKMLQRVYGIVFPTKIELTNHLERLELAKQRDHKKLGKELELFMFSEYGSGFPFWLPKGMVLKRELENFWYEEHEKEGYVFINTPLLLNQELWELSGHWAHYQENMYQVLIDQTKYAIKPMNCPGSLLVYKNNLYSYRDLPLRMGELGLVHRHEASGALNGLFRLRSFTQDDAHIFMTPDQVKGEIIRLLNFIDRIYQTFGLEYTIELSTRPLTNYIGTIEAWTKAEQTLVNACQEAGKECKLNPGDGAFYGPKLDFHVKDSLGRIWQCATIQLDANLPERFDLVYITETGTRERPIMVHRVIYGALERFVGILIEHYGGAFPLWLAPVQVQIIPINNEFHQEYANSLKEVLVTNGIRVQIDERAEKVSYKMREAQVKKIPYIVVIGDRERDNGTVSYRRYGEKDTINIDGHKFIDLLVTEIKKKN